MRPADKWAIHLLRVPRFSLADVASTLQSRDARGFDRIQLYFRLETSLDAYSARARGQRVAKCQRIYMALRLDSIRDVPSCLGLLRTEEVWLQLRTWGVGRDRIRSNSSDWGSCTAPISMDGMELGGTPWNLVGFSTETRNRCGLGSCSAGVGFYLLQLRVTGPIAGQRQGTCSFCLRGSLYYSRIKFVNGFAIRRSRCLVPALFSSSKRFRCASQIVAECRDAKVISTHCRKVACSGRDANRSPSRVVLSPKVRLCLKVCCCEHPAAFRRRPKERVWYQRTPFEFRS